MDARQRREIDRERKRASTRTRARFSAKKVQAIQRLRSWERNPRPVRPERCYGVDELLRWQAREDLPLTVPPFLDLSTVRGRVAPLLVGLVGRLCLDQGKEGLVGALPKFAELLGCCRRTLQDALSELERLHLVRRGYRFDYAPGFVGRDGKEHTHRERTPALMPAGALRTEWGAWRNRQQAEAQRREQARRRAKWREEQRRRKERRQQRAWEARARELLQYERTGTPRPARDPAVIKGGRKIQPSEPDQITTACSASSSSVDRSQGKAERGGAVDNSPAVPRTHVSGAQAPLFWLDQTLKSTAAPSDGARPPAEPTPTPSPSTRAGAAAQVLHHVVQLLRACPDTPALQAAREALDQAAARVHTMPSTAAQLAADAAAYLDIAQDRDGVDTAQLWTARGLLQQLAMRLKR
jgi:hypothetical protein